MFSLWWSIHHFEVSSLLQKRAADTTDCWLSAWPIPHVADQRSTSCNCIIVIITCNWVSTWDGHSGSLAFLPCPCHSLIFIFNSIQFTETKWRVLACRHCLARLVWTFHCYYIILRKRASSYTVLTHSLTHSNREEITPTVPKPTTDRQC